MILSVSYSCTKIISLILKLSASYPHTETQFHTHQLLVLYPHTETISLIPIPQ